MSRNLRALRWAVLGLLLLPAAAAEAPAWTGPTLLLSATPDGDPAAEDAWVRAIDADGSTVVLTTLSPDLLGPGERSRGLVVHDVAAGTNRPVRVTWEGEEPAGWWDVLGLSPDGDQLYFRWTADEPSPVPSKAFVQDLGTGETRAFAPEHEGAVLEPRGFGGISADGRTIGFVATGGEDDVTAYAWIDGEVQRLGPGFLPGVSADGRWVAYLADGVHVHDLASGERTLVVPPTQRAQEDADDEDWIFPSRVHLSRDGNLVAYEAYAPDGAMRIHVHDRARGTTQQVAFDAADPDVRERQVLRGMSDDGAVVLFSAFGEHGDGRGTRWGVYAHDRAAGTNLLVDAADPALVGRCASSEGGGNCNGWSQGTMSADGSTVAFDSSLVDLHPAFSDEEGTQAFLRRLPGRDGGPRADAPQDDALASQDGEEARGAPVGWTVPLAAVLGVAVRRAQARARISRRT